MDTLGLLARSHRRLALGMQACTGSSLSLQWPPPPFKAVPSLTLNLQVLGPNPPYYWVINVPMLALYVIHCYWLYLIIRAVVHLVVTGKAEDVREDED